MSSTPNRDYREIGIIPRPKRDNRPAMKVYMDLENGLLVVDRERYELDIKFQDHKRKAELAGVGIPNHPIGQSTRVQVPVTTADEVAKNVLERNNPPFGFRKPIADKPKTLSDIVIFKGRAR